MLDSNLHSEQTEHAEQSERTSPYQTPEEQYQTAYQQDDQTFPAMGPLPPQGGGMPPAPPQKPGKRGPRTAAIVVLTVVIALVFGTGLFAGWQFGRSPVVTPNTGLQSNNNNALPTIPAQNGSNSDEVREAVIANVRPAVVQINVQTAQGSGIGSGVIIDKNGYIVTNNHVVDGAQTVEVVLYDNTKISGKVVGTDPEDDLAIVKIEPRSNLVVASLGDSSKLRVGQSVLAIGNPLGIKQTVTSGIVSALGRSVSEGSGTVIPNAIQTDAPINPGNSGGALVDMNGRLIGIPTLAAIDPEFRTPASGVGFAIPSNRVNFIAQQIIQSGKVTHSGRAALGIRVTDVDAVVASRNNLSTNHGAMVVAVTSGGGAAQAGLQVGDVIVQIDSATIDDTTSLSDVLANKNPGDKITLKVFRGSQQMTINATLGELQVG